MTRLSPEVASEPAQFKHRALLISVNRTVRERSIYDAVRFAWRLDVRRARKAEVILATVRGQIVGAFVADEWLEATQENFPVFGLHRLGRYAFTGKEAPPEICQEYIGKRIPDEYRKHGAANPIKYTWK